MLSTPPLNNFPAMHYADIPLDARPLEVAILMLYDPQRDNKKEVRWLLHLKSVRSVQKVVTKYSSYITIKSVQRDALLRYTPDDSGENSISSFSPPLR